MFSRISVGRAAPTKVVAMSEFAQQYWIASLTMFTPLAVQWATAFRHPSRIAPLAGCQAGGPSWVSNPMPTGAALTPNKRPYQWVFRPIIEEPRSARLTKPAKTQENQRIRGRARVRVRLEWISRFTYCVWHKIPPFRIPGCTDYKAIARANFQNFGRILLSF